MTVVASRFPYLVHDALLASPEANGARVAVTDGARTFSYDELERGARTYAELFGRVGVGAGDRVGILLPSSVDAIAAFIGISLASGVAVPVNERLKAGQVRYIAEHSDMKAVVADTRLVSLLDGLPDLSRVVVAEPLRPAGAVPAHGRECAPAARIGKDIALLLYTSGSTGMPKGVMVTHENLIWGIALVSDYLGLTANDVLVTALPLSFDYGLNQVLTALAAGGRVVVERSTHPAALCRTIARESVTGLAGVPFLWQQLTQRHSPFLTDPLPSLRYVTNSGGSLDPKIVASIRRCHPHVDVYLMYGLTEAFRSTYLAPEEVDARPMSIGMAIPNVEISVVDPDGVECPPLQVGELVHRGPTVSGGYWNDPDATALVFRPWRRGDTETEVAVWSGDLAYRDEDGFLYFAGRRDSMFKSRGIRVNPEEVEHELRACDAVADAIVFATGVDGPDLAIIAAVLLVPGGTVEAVHCFCHNELPVHLRPARIVRANEIPHTLNGKPDRVRALELWG
jgi:amino acid adenylation domain-containing protein